MQQISGLKCRRVPHPVAQDCSGGAERACMRAGVSAPSLGREMGRDGGMRPVLMALRMASQALAKLQKDPKVRCCRRTVLSGLCPERVHNLRPAGSKKPRTPWVCGAWYEQPPCRGMETGVIQRSVGRARGRLFMAVLWARSYSAVRTLQISGNSTTSSIFFR
jgi:hypothetical protein